VWFTFDYQWEHLPEGDEPKFQLQRIKWLNKEAKSLNLQLVPA